MGPLCLAGVTACSAPAPTSQQMVRLSLPEERRKEESCGHHDMPSTPLACPWNSRMGDTLLRRSHSCRGGGKEDAGGWEATAAPQLRHSCAGGSEGAGEWEGAGGRVCTGEAGSAAGCPLRRLGARQGRAAAVRLAARQQQGSCANGRTGAVHGQGTPPIAESLETLTLPK